MDKQLQQTGPEIHQQDQLSADLKAAVTELRQAEAELAREQAAVNRFRMHCRLMLDNLVDDIQALLAQKQSLLTSLQLMQQEQDDALATTENPLGPEGGDPTGPSNDLLDEDLLLPTNVPRDKAAEQRLYRDLARRFHPDLAQSAVEAAYRTSMMAAVNQAYAEEDIHTLYDLAGELEPDEIAGLAVIESTEQRRLQNRLLQCRRRHRKVQRQHQILRRESTARLWRKAQEMEETDEDWWAVVRRDLSAARARLQEETAELQEQLRTV